MSNVTAEAPLNPATNAGYNNGAGYNSGAGGYAGGTGNHFNEKSHGYGNNNFGYHGTMAPAEGFGPHSDDPVSYQRYFSRVANPGPLGLYAFAYSTFLWSFYLVHTRGIHSTNFMVAVGFFIGGLAQFLAGMWEFPRGNVFGSTMFTLYAAFYFAYGLILWPNAGVRAGFSSTSEFNNALGLFYIVWFIITFLLLFVVLRRNISFILLFFFWMLTYLMLAVASWATRSASALTVAGGAFGFVTAIVALYIATSQLIRSEVAWGTGFRMPLGHLGPRAGRDGVGAGAGAGAGTTGAAGRV